MSASDFKTLSDLVPRYDGNPKRLNAFIRQIDGILSLVSVEGAMVNLVAHLIISRLEGAAVDAIAYETNLTTWNDIKFALLRRLGDPRNEVQVMQELMRLRRNRTEDSEAFGKRLRELLDTLYSVGQHADKSYYEKMAIEQYVNQLEFHVSIGVRIATPNTLESAIIAARQEEARLVCYPPPSTSQQKPKELPKPQFPFKPMFGQPSNLSFPPVNNQNYVPQPNNWTPEQRQQFVRSMLPWKNQQQGNVRNSGQFRNPNNNIFRGPQPNIPRQQVNPPQVVSDVTMRSVGKPQTPQFAVQELFYTPNENYYQGNDPQSPYYDPGEYCYANMQANEPPFDMQACENNQVSDPQDFIEDKDEGDQS